MEMLLLILERLKVLLKKMNLIPREILKTGDRVKAYCYEVKKELKGHQIFFIKSSSSISSKTIFSGSSRDL